MLKKIIIVAILLVLASAATVCANGEVRDLPVLMYHSIDDTNGAYSVTNQKFQRDIESLLSAGYTPVSFDEVIGFVYRSGELPQKPVVITFDDGYRNNYEVAYPIVKEKNVKIEIFTIVGFAEYGALSFNWDMAREMEQSGLVNIGCHTFNLHSFEDVNRIGVGRKEGESFREWERLLRKDLAYAKIFTMDAIGQEPITFAYPYGNFSADSETIIRESGYLLTVTSEPGIATIRRGDPESLYLLPRISMDNKREYAAAEIENHRNLKTSQKILDCRSKVHTGAYASRADALFMIYKNIPESMPVDMSILGAFVDTKYLVPDKARVLALGASGGIIRGFEDYTLGADCYITRGEFAVMLARKAGIAADAEVVHSFPDSDTWNQAALSWCRDNGYMIGYPDGSFGIGDFLTSEQLEIIYSRINKNS